MLFINLVFINSDLGPYLIVTLVAMLYKAKNIIRVPNMRSIIQLIEKKP